MYGGACEECKSGSTQRCDEPGHATLGIFTNGGMAETVVVPESALLALPAQLDVKDACLIEPVQSPGMRRITQTCSEESAFSWSAAGR